MYKSSSCDRTRVIPQRIAISKCLKDTFGWNIVNFFNWILVQFYIEENLNLDIKNNVIETTFLVPQQNVIQIGLKHIFNHFID